MNNVDLIQHAITAMTRDPDRRWQAVAELLGGGPLGYARMIESHPDRDQMALRYPDASRAVAVARAYLVADAAEDTDAR